MRAGQRRHAPETLVSCGALTLMRRLMLCTLREGRMISVASRMCGRPAGRGVWGGGGSHQTQEIMRRRGPLGPTIPP